MTWNNLLHLMNDIRERILPKNITYILFVKKKVYLTPLCTVEFLLFLPYLDFTLPLSLHRNDPPEHESISTLTCPLPASLYRQTFFFRFDTISLTVCATFFSLLVGTSVNIRRFVSDSKASPYNTNEPKCWTLKSRNDCLLP